MMIRLRVAEAHDLVMAHEPVRDQLLVSQPEIGTPRTLVVHFNSFAPSPVDFLV